MKSHKINSFIIFFCFVFTIHCYGARPLSDILYAGYDRPSRELLKVLNAYGIEHDGSWESIIEETQKKWLRKEGSERWDIEPVKGKDNYDLFTRVNMTNTIAPSLSNYDYVVILGSTLPQVRRKFDYLLDEWEKGLRFKNLVFLTGDRDLNPDEVIEMAQNEKAMMRILYDQYPFPPSIRQLPLIVVDVPKYEGRRPNTKDTFYKWRQINSKLGRTLIITNQPFLGRADTIAREFFPSFLIETVGSGFPHEEFLKNPKSTAILLDELARWIYEEYESRTTIPRTCTNCY